MSRDTKFITVGGDVKIKDVRKIYKVVYRSPMSHETVFVLAENIEKAVEKARNYQNSYTLICDMELVSMELVSETFI